MGGPARRWRARLDLGPRVRRPQRGRGPVRSLGVLGGDGGGRARSRRRRERGPRRVRRHRERPHRADGDGDVLGALHADLLSRLGLQGRARRADRHVHLLVHAHAPRRGGQRAELRRDDGGVVPRARDPPVRDLPRSCDPPAPAGRRRRARREGRPQGAARGARGGREAGRACSRSGPVQPAGRAGARRSDGSRRRDPGARLPRAREVGSCEQLPRRAAPSGRRLRLGGRGSARRVRT